MGLRHHLNPDTGRLVISGEHLRSILSQYRGLVHVRAERCSTGLVLCHSDQGCQYTSKHFQDFLKTRQIIASMSRKGNCYDNAVMESFWATLKKETGISRIYHSKEEARSVIFSYVEEFYNRVRLHSALGYRSPTEFEQQCISLNYLSKLSREDHTTPQVS